MDESIPLTQRPDFWRKFIFWGLFLLFLLAFWGEIWQTLVTLWRLLSAGLSCFLVLFYRLPREGCQKSLEAATLTPEMRRGIFITLINLLAYLGVAGFSIFQAAQFALPVRTFDERMKAFNRILLYLRGQHGPAIFVKEGKANTRADEADKVLPGVALVDLSSAIVLEQQKNTVAWQLNHLRAEQKTVEAEASGKPLFAVKQIVRKLNGETPPWVRVAGPGVVFTDAGEKIHSVVDLRKQTRANGKAQVFTRDGIKLEMPLFVVFSLSNAPEVMTVGYVGGKEQKNLRWLKFEPAAKGSKDQKLTDIFEIDPDDQAEIHNYVQYGHVHVDKHPSPATRPVKTPYPFYPDRVFAAAYAKALTSADATPWDDLPLKVALDIFCKEIEKYDFEGLFQPDQPDNFPLAKIKAEIARRVVYQGLLSYKLARPVGSEETSETTWNTHPFAESDKGRVWKAAELKISPVRELFGSKILRDRGICVLTAGFPEFRPAEDAVKNKLVEGWMAHVEKDLTMIKAQRELETMRELSRARAQTQSEMTYVLSNLFQTTPHSKEALALRIFQSLEKAASSNLDPKEVLSMLQNLHKWLLIERKEKPKPPHDSKPPRSETPPGEPKTPPQG